jgi:hypothetical protein
MNILAKYSIYNVLRNADGGGGGAAGGAAAAGGAVAGGAAAGGAAAGGAAAGGASEPFYKPWGLDDAASKQIIDRGFTEPKALVQSWMEADRIARARNVFEKPDPTKPQEWKGFTELGWTEDPAKYTVEKPDLGEGGQIHDGIFSAFTQAAHKAKVAPWQAKEIYGEVAKVMNVTIAEQDAAAQRASQELDQKLRTEWKADYDRNKALAGRAMSALGVAAQDAGEIEKLLGAPSMVKLFHTIGGLMGEDQLVGQGGGVGISESIEKIEADKRAFAANPQKTKALGDPSHPQHKDVSAEWAKIAERLAKAQKAKAA